MTTIESVEALDGQAVGTIITVGDNSNVWEKKDNGWQRMGWTLEGIHFTGDIQQGRVSVGVRPERGQLWSDEGAPNHGYSHLLIQQDTEREGQWWAIRFYQGRYNSVTRIRTIPGQIVTDRPAWYDMAFSMGAHYISMQADRDRYAKALTEERQRYATVTNEQREQMNTLQSNVQSALHAYITEHEEARETFNELLQANGMRRANEVTTVKAQVRITRYVTFPASVVQEHFGLEGVTNSQDQSVLVSADVELEQAVEVEAGTCGCALFGRPQVRTALSTRSLDYYDFTIMSRSCGHGHDNPF